MVLLSAEAAIFMVPLLASVIYGRFF